MGRSRDRTLFPIIAITEFGILPPARAIGFVAKSGIKQKRAQKSDNRRAQASPCVFEELGRRVGLVKNIQGLAWPLTGTSLS